MISTSKNKFQQSFRVEFGESVVNKAFRQESALTLSLAKISEDFKIFICDISPLVAYSKTNDELSDVLIEWLVSIDAYSEEILRNEVSSDAVDDSMRLFRELEHFLIAQNRFRGFSGFANCDSLAMSTLLEIYDDTTLFR